MKHIIRLMIAGFMLSGMGSGFARADNHDTDTGETATTGASPANGEATEDEPGVDGAGHEIVIGAGAVSGVYFPAAGAICRVITAGNAETRCLVESNANSSINIERLTSGLLDFAIVQSDWLMHAARGTNLFQANGPDESLRAVMALHAEPLTLIVRTGANIAGPADLKGKRISVGPPFTYQRVLLETLLRAWDIDTDDLALVQEITATEQFAALCAGDIDAGAIVTAHPSPALADAMRRCDLKLAPIAGDELNELLAARPELSSAVIPGGLYEGVPNAVPTFGLRAILASTVNVEDSLVEQVTGAVLDAMIEFTGQHPALASITTDSMTSASIALPLHPGAKAAFRARGLLPAE
ncbi:MAG: TAXI family TRAP transporter solute-binding subunit [Alphaproteobacteria bacterium]|nr:TAXI family TRAP transporter solute-binding subunit [Alphaproteobacteria bacterium]